MMKKIAIAAAVAMLMAGAVSAQTAPYDIEDSYNTDSVTDSGDAINNVTGDVTNGILGSNSANLGQNNTGNFQFNMSFDDIAAGVGAMASNTAAINGSINLTGANITISAQDVEANALAKAEAATESTSTATSNAFSGSTFSATAIGALMSASIEVDSSMITNSDTFTSTQLGFTGGDLELSATDFELHVHRGEDYVFGPNESTVMDQAEFAGNIASTQNRVTSIGVQLVASNTAAIDASVNMIADYQAGNVFHAPSGGMIDLTNINITTTAVGAINSGSIRLGSLLSSQ